MNTIRPLWLLIILGAAGVLGWCATLITAGAGLSAPVLGLPSVITLAAVGLIVLVLGLRVRRDQDRPAGARMDPLAAARTLVLAQAGAYAGSLIAGWHAGVLVHLLGATGPGSRTTNDAWVMVIAGLVLVILGYVVEQFCRIPPEDGTGGGNGVNGTPRQGMPRTDQGPAYGREGDHGHGHYGPHTRRTRS